MRFSSTVDIEDFELALVSNIAGELNGTILLPDGVTPAGIGVDVTVSGGSLPDVTVRTDVDGRYSFAKIFSASRYTLTASDSVTGKLARETIFLQEDQDLTVDMRLLGRSSVEVTVVDGAGGLVEQVFVQLASASFPFDKAAGAITASDAGKILFDRISEGRFSVTASDSLGRGGRGSGTATEDGGDVQVTISLSVTGTLRGTYVSADGTVPIPISEVILRQGNTGRLLGATTTSNAPGELGRFEFLFAPAGTLLVTATDPITGRIGEASATIDTEGEILDVEIRQLGLGKIAGTVTSGGASIASAEVSLTSSTGLSSSVANLRASATTNASGAFMFDGVPVGNFTLEATVPGLLLIGSATGAIDRDGQEITDIEITLEPSGTVTGDVFRPDGATTVPGAALTLRLSKGVLRGETNASGRYVLDFVPAGALSLTAEEQNGADAGIATGTLAEGGTLELDVTFNGTGTVSGTALDSSGALLASGRVRLTRAAPFARDVTATVDSNGVFQFGSIPVGDYNLSLTVTGSLLRGSATGNISVDGATDNPVIQLADAGNVFGILVKPDGAGGTVAAPNVPVTASGSFMLSTLTDSSGAFRLEGLPLGDFSLRAEDPITNGLAIVSATMSTNGEELDIGTLELDIDPVAIAGVSPANGAIDIAPDTTVLITLTDPVTPNALPGRVFIRSGGSNLSGATSLSPDGLTVSFTATVALPP